jgi:hypothetical protein
VIPPVELQSASFTKGDTGPFLTNVVFRFANEDMAKKFMDLTATTVESCRSYESNGAEVKLGPVDFPHFRDDTYAVRADGTNGNGTFSGDLVYVRHGTRVTSIQTLGVNADGVSHGLLVSIVNLVQKRL